MDEENKEITSEIDQLAVVVAAQSHNIQELLGAVSIYAEQLDERPTKSGVWKIGGAIAGLVVAFIMFLSWLAYSASDDSLAEIKSCTTPTGECARRGAESQTQAIGQIVCNQEKIVYFFDDSYAPFDYCVQFINNEIERTGVDALPLPVPGDVPQIVLNDEPRNS